MKRRLLLSLLLAAVTAALAVAGAGAAVKPHDVTAGSSVWGLASWSSSSWDSVRPHDMTAGLASWDVTAGFSTWRAHPRDVTAGFAAWSAARAGKVRPSASSWS